MNAQAEPERVYWISKCKRFVARVTKVNYSPTPDVVEISTGRAWLTHRWKLTGFDDPRVGLPEFDLMPIVWSNLGRWTRDRSRYIEAFRIRLADFDMTKVERGYTPTTEDFEVEFHHKLPKTHARKRALVDAAIEEVERTAA